MTSRILALLASFLILATSTRAQDNPEHFWVMNEVLPSLSIGDVDKLEATGNAYLNSKDRMTDGTWKIDAFNDAFEMFSMGGRQDPQPVFDKWYKAYPASKVLPVAHARFLRSQAFAARGTKVASEVWEEDWAKFESLLKRALSILEKSRSAASSNPAYYSAVVGIKGALGLPKAEMLAAAREGLAKEPTYTQTPREALNFLLPKWGGSARAVKAWLDDAAATTKSTEGDAVYAFLAWQIIASRYDFAELRGQIDWQRLKKAADDRIARYPTTANKVRALDVACKFHDAEEVIKRYRVVAKDAGPKMAQTVEPEIYCKWPRKVARDPEVVDPESLPRQ